MAAHLSLTADQASVTEPPRGEIAPAEFPAAVFQSRFAMNRESDGGAQDS
jgi:hypothetical protein